MRDDVIAHFPRLAIVTGADSGIGQATAKLLATEGFDIGMTAHHDIEGAEETKREIIERGQRCFVERFDAAAPDAGLVVDRLADQLGGVGVLVNDAGTGHSEKVLDLGFDTWRRVIATDLETVSVPKVEVHISNVHDREEEWRRISVISPVVDAVVAGMGSYSYRAAVGYVLDAAVCG